MQNKYKVEVVMRNHKSKVIVYLLRRRQKPGIVAKDDPSWNVDVRNVCKIPLTRQPVNEDEQYSVFRPHQTSHQSHIFQLFIHARSDSHWFFSAENEYRHEKVTRAIFMTRMRQFTWRLLPVWHKNHENCDLYGFKYIAHLLILFFDDLRYFVLPNK